jgi:hypothetical protein
MSVTAPPPQSSAPWSDQSRSRKRRRIAWGAICIFVLLAGIAIYAAVHQGVKTINFKQGTISFQNVHPGSIQRSQTYIKSQFSLAKQQAQQQAAPAPQVPNISGYWYSNSGLTYYIEQYGSSAALEEESAYGVTAVAQGTVGQSQADFDFRAYNGSTGQAIFYFQSGGTMDASFSNYTYGTSSQAVLSRQ